MYFEFRTVRSVSVNNNVIRLWLWLFKKIAENNSCSRYFAEFIQTRKLRYNSLDKINILT